MFQTAVARLRVNPEKRRFNLPGFGPGIFAFTVLVGIGWRTASAETVEPTCPDSPWAVSEDLERREEAWKNPETRISALRHCKVILGTIDKIAEGLSDPGEKEALRIARLHLDRAIQDFDDLAKRFRALTKDATGFRNAMSAPAAASVDADVAHLRETSNRRLSRLANAADLDGAEVYRALVENRCLLNSFLHCLGGELAKRKIENLDEVAKLGPSDVPSLQARLRDFRPQLDAQIERCQCQARGCSDCDSCARQTECECIEACTVMTPCGCTPLPCAPCQPCGPCQPCSPYQPCAPCQESAPCVPCNAPCEPCPPAPPNYSGRYSISN